MSKQRAMRSGQRILSVHIQRLALTLRGLFPGWIISDRVFCNLLCEDDVIITPLSLFGLLFQALYLSLCPLILVVQFLILLHFRFRSRAVSLSDFDSELLVSEKSELDIQYFVSLNPSHVESFSRVDLFDLCTYYSAQIPFILYVRRLPVVVGEILFASFLATNRARLLAFFKGVANIHRYVAYRSFFAFVQRSSCTSASFVSMNLLHMHAASREGLRVSLYHHGISIKNLSLSLPRFDMIYVITEQEKRYFSKYLSSQSVRVYPAVRVEDHRDVAILLLRQVITLRDKTNSSGMMSLSGISSMVSAMHESRIHVVVKIHPRTSASDLDVLREALGGRGIEYETGSLGFKDRLHDLRPKLVFGWYSSGLAEALSNGVIPVRMTRRVENKKARKVSAFDFERSTVCFHDERHLVLECLKDACLYRDVLSSLSCGEGLRRLGS